MAPVQSLSIIDRRQEQKRYIKHELSDGHGLHKGAQEEARRQRAQAGWVQGTDLQKVL